MEVAILEARVVADRVVVVLVEAATLVEAALVAVAVDF